MKSQVEPARTSTRTKGRARVFGGWGALIVTMWAVLATPCEARMLPHVACDPDIAAFEDAISAESRLASLKTAVDESWDALRQERGVSSNHAAITSRARETWLCDVKSRCGADVAAGRACIAHALQRRRTDNEAMHRRYLLRHSGQPKP